MSTVLKCLHAIIPDFSFSKETFVKTGTCVIKNYIIEELDTSLAVPISWKKTMGKNGAKKYIQGINL